jgi:radical SAM superfamily enzyme YgiQ (UPF0313 family)
MCIRDRVLADRQHGDPYLREIVAHHTSGQLKVAPEHADTGVLSLMGKPTNKSLLDFKARFERFSSEVNKKQYLTYYFIAAYPGCSDREMRKLHDFTSNQLHLDPEQVQIFTPPPSTYGSVMYFTEMNPFTGEPIFVEKDLKRKQAQKDLVTRPSRQSKAYVPHKPSSLPHKSAPGKKKAIR